MIKRLNYKNIYDVIEFILRCQDKFNDFYITKDKDRIFLNDLKIVEKILKYQEVYCYLDKEIQGLILIYREKEYRPYLKILAKDSKIYYGLIKFLNWNFSQLDLFVKLKKDNPLIQILNKYGFYFKGNRGKEVLLFRKGRPLRPKKGAKENGKDSN